MRSQESRRVVLNLAAVKTLLVGRKVAEVAAQIESPRRQRRGWEASGKIYPSALSRILRGRRHPQLRLARAIALALGKEPAELILRFAEDRHARENDDWVDDMLRGRRFPEPLKGYLRYLGYLAACIHWNDVVGRETHRIAVPSLDGVIGFGAIRVSVETRHLPAEIIVSFQPNLGEREVPTFIDYGVIRVARRRATGYELWTGRTTASVRASARDPVCVRTWLHGSATVFLLRSDRPFRVHNESVARRRIPRGSCVITFYPTALHLAVGGNGERS